MGYEDCPREILREKPLVAPIMTFSSPSLSTCHGQLSIAHALDSFAAAHPMIHAITSAHRDHVFRLVLNSTVQGASNNLSCEAE